MSAEINSISEPPDAIVFIHYGLPSYLVCSLWQAHVASPGTRIILLSSERPGISFVEWHDLNDFQAMWREMEKVYVHLSTNLEAFERFCFYRWFVLRTFMKSAGLVRVLHLDSDILLYCNVANEIFDFGSAPLAIGSSGSYSGHCAFILSMDVLDRICQFMLDMFIDPLKLGVLRTHFQKQRASGGGVCDMFAFGWMARDQIIPIYELNQVKHGRIFDQSIGDNRISGPVPHCPVPYFAMEEPEPGPRARSPGPRKKIIWVNGQLHFLTMSGDQVRACTIHFQGNNKNLMRRYMSARPTRFYLDWAPVRVTEGIKLFKENGRSLSRHYRGGITRRLKRLTA